MTVLIGKCINVVNIAKKTKCNDKIIFINVGCFTGWLSKRR